MARTSETALDVITVALRQIGELAADETPTPEDAADCLKYLNDMIHGWKLKGIDLNWVTLTQAQVLPVEEVFVEGIKVNLAVRIAPEYGATTAPEIAVLARDAFMDFQAHTSYLEDELHVDPALSVRHIRHREVDGWYNIEEG